MCSTQRHTPASAKSEIHEILELHSAKQKQEPEDTNNIISPLSEREAYTHKLATAVTGHILNSSIQKDDL